MPISVTCSGCKATFTVSDKFAGKEGPCPKCKAKIKIPELGEQVTIHGPDEGPAGAATATGNPISKPIRRQETKLELIPTAIAAASAMVVVVATFALGKQLQDILALRAVGLLVISPPIVAAGYTFLRNDDLEPHRGKSLWMRAGICGLAYAALWGGFYFVPEFADPFMWLFIVPPFLALGAGVAFASLEIDITNGFFHYTFYVALTLGLGWAAGLHMPWMAPTG